MDFDYSIVWRIMFFSNIYLRIIFGKYLFENMDYQVWVLEVGCFFMRSRGCFSVVKFLNLIVIKLI